MGASIAHCWSMMKPCCCRRLEGRGSSQPPCRGLPVQTPLIPQSMISLVHGGLSRSMKNLDTGRLEGAAEADMDLAMELHEAVGARKNGAFLPASSSSAHAVPFLYSFISCDGQGRLGCRPHCHRGRAVLRGVGRPVWAQWSAFPAIVGPHSGTACDDAELLDSSQSLSVQSAVLVTSPSISEIRNLRYVQHVASRQGYERTNVSWTCQSWGIDWKSRRLL